MWRQLRFTIRWKILITLLFVVTLVVSLITFTMARMFHEDKKAYIHDLSAIVALNTAAESESLLVGYGNLLKTYARIMGAGGVDPEERARMLREFLGDFPDLVVISLLENSEETASAYNSRALEAAGLSKEDVRRQLDENPLPSEGLQPGEVLIRNSLLSTSLPTFSIAVGYGGQEGATAAVSALIRLDRLEQIAGRSGVFEVYLLDSEGILLAHRSTDRLGQPADELLLGIFERMESGHSAGMTQEYRLGQTEMVGGFANLTIGGVRAGVQIPKSAAFLASRDLLRSLLAMALGLLLLATAMGLFWSRRITRSVERLSDATEEIGKGQFEVHVDVASKDEIGSLANSFNQMTWELKSRELKLAEAQKQLLQSEKMAAFGQLGAGIAHEVKNPLAGILGCAQLSLRKTEKETPLFKNLKLIEKETKRCKEIIENLLKFARQEKAAFRPVDVNSIVEDGIAIVRHQLEMHKVKLEGDLAEPLPPVHGNANQLQQVLINLIINAQQAMDENGGSVTVSTRLPESGQVEIRVTDTGPGMLPEVREHIFEPFFTTKPGGKGTGLGLSVSFGIIQDHKGTIEIQSEQGRGSTFLISLPRLQENELIEQDPTPKMQQVESAGAGQ